MKIIPTFARLIPLVLVCLLNVGAHAGPVKGVPLTADNWVVQAKEYRFEEHLGRPSLYIHGGMAWIPNSKFTDGIIEFDIAFSGARGFAGVLWRMQDTGNYEEFYVRPHQSGNPDANQYTPAFHGLTSWQLYHGPGYGAPVEYLNDAWNRIRIVVSGVQAEVYVNDMETPLLFIPEQKRTIEEGHVGLNAFFAPAHFSSFHFESMPSPVLKDTPPALPAAPPGTIEAWSISDAFSEASLVDVVRLSDVLKRRTWSSLQAEASGLANLARIQERTDGQDTAFARVVVRSEADQTARVRFGFSDRVRLYLNDRLLYLGDNSYRSRDYRYLGTIGYFDEVSLPLVEGDNELWFAVSEDFGGWGIQAAIRSHLAVTVVAPVPGPD